jgi:hypothetical protein
MSERPRQISEGRRQWLQSLRLSSGGPGKGRRGQENLLVREDYGLRNRENGLRDSDCLHDDVDHGRACKENGFGRADYGLICQSNFRHRTFDAEKSFAKPMELRNL